MLCMSARGDLGEKPRKPFRHGYAFPARAPEIVGCGMRVEFVGAVVCSGRFAF